MKILAFCSLVLCTLTYVHAQQNSNKNRRTSRPFRYVILDNNIDPSLGKDDPERRFVEVLMESKAFSRKNLITLFHLISKRFPKPTLLYVNIFTDLEDVATPEEQVEGSGSGSYDGRGSSRLRPKIGRVVQGHNKATIVRRVDKTVRLIINFPNGDSEVVEVK